MNDPEIETRIVIIRDAANSFKVDPVSDLKSGVIFRMSRIMTRNIMKAAKRTRVSLTEISVDVFLRFSPKKVPIRVCQVSEIIMVSFHKSVFG